MMTVIPDGCKAWSSRADGPPAPVTELVKKCLKIKEGLIAIFTAVEPCLSYSVRGDHQTKQSKLVLETRKCTHLYHDYIHEQFGMLHVRVQSWLPFSVDVCFNVQAWLARQMDSAGIGYDQRDNCFVWVSDPVAAQQLWDQQLQTDWSSRLDELLTRAHPLQVGG